jgi:hypothetical protein
VRRLVLPRLNYRGFDALHMAIYSRQFVCKYGYNAVGQTRFVFCKIRSRRPRVTAFSLNLRFYGVLSPGNASCPASKVTES